LGEISSCVSRHEEPHKKKGRRLDRWDACVFPYQQVPNCLHLEQKPLSWVSTRHAKKASMVQVAVGKKAPELGCADSQTLVCKSSSRPDWKFGSNWILPIGKI